MKLKSCLFIILFFTSCTTEDKDQLASKIGEQTSSIAVTQVTSGEKEIDGNPDHSPAKPVQQENSRLEVNSKTDQLYLVEEKAHFPGGKASLEKYMGYFLVFPRSAENDVEGKCYVRFMVSKSGVISDAAIVKTDLECKECERRIMQFIYTMPKWLPGKINGKPVDSYVILPVSFKLV